MTHEERKSAREKLVRRAVELKADGKSVRQITETLNEEGFKTPKTNLKIYNGWVSFALSTHGRLNSRKRRASAPIVIPYVSPKVFAFYGEAEAVADMVRKMA